MESFRWDPGVWLLANEQVKACLVEMGPEAFDCKVGIEARTPRGSDIAYGWIVIWNEKGKEIYAANLGFPCPGPGCPELA